MGKRLINCKGVKVSPRKVWELGFGHNVHRSGSGIHDSRPKRQRTRREQVQAYIKEWG